MEDINRILVVSRMTGSCARALHYGVSLAKKYKAALTVVHVTHNPYGLKGWNLPLPNLEKDYQNLLKSARADLDKIIAKEKKKGMRIDVLMLEGKPTKEILGVVKKRKIDLLVMLAHEEGRIDHFLFGRSNEDLIRKLPCSILLVKQEPGPVAF